MPFVEFENRTRSVGPGVLTIGSAPEAGWRITGRGIEPLHAILSLETAGRARIVAGSPAAVILVNGVELPEGKGLLQFGDTFTLGTAGFRYRQLAMDQGEGTAYLRDMRRDRVYQLGVRDTIGRDPTCTVSLTELDISRHHVEIVQDGRGYIASPVGAAVVSLNGDRLIERALLLEGDELRISNTVLRFTTTRPVGSIMVPRDASTRRPESRSLSAQTTFMGRIEVREHHTRHNRRRATRVAAIGLTVVAVVLTFMAMYYGAQTPVTPRHHRMRPVSDARAVR
ncbi:MAG TPA: FHA domain-containing protein [Gemmatimonadaceae bacterium]|jgi:predicted component of type VI protein secretion system|nr:FHA domain-containing protein [Gemmatimonadaceae bacterium]